MEKVIKNTREEWSPDSKMFPNEPCFPVSHTGVISSQVVPGVVFMTD